MSERVTGDRLAAVIDAACMAGRSVAVVVGAFDLLQVDHVRALSDAAQGADILVAVVIDDESVRAIEGDGWPILSAADRAELVEALRWVDYVAVLADRDVRDLAASSADIASGSPPEAAESPDQPCVVDSRRGRLRVIADPAGPSTRDLFARIASGPR